MIEEILPNLFKIELPLPHNPLRSINSYVVKGPERNVIIDPGMNQKECKEAMEAALNRLGIDLTKTDFFITHFHVDHLGLASELATESSRIHMSEADAEGFEKVRNGTFWVEIIHLNRMSGFPDKELQKVLSSHPALRYGFKGDMTFEFIEEGDQLEVGDYHFQCVKTPGHSEGHMCLYEPDSKILLSGDHLLNDITPIISLRSDNLNPLREYIASLEKVGKLDVNLVLPGHRMIFGNPKKRINELKDHHQKRSLEITRVLKEGPQNAYQVASKMHWDVTCDSWDLFPVLQKWFALGETNAHLKYLEEEGVLSKERQEKMIAYRLN